MALAPAPRLIGLYSRRPATHQNQSDQKTRNHLVFHVAPPHLFSSVPIRRRCPALYSMKREQPDPQRGAGEEPPQSSQSPPNSLCFPLGDKSSGS